MKSFKDLIGKLSPQRREEIRKQTEKLRGQADMETVGVGDHRCPHCGELLLSDFHNGGYEGNTWSIWCPKGCKLESRDRAGIDPTRCLHSRSER